MEYEPKPIDPTKVVIARRWSAVEWEMQRYHLNEQQIYNRLKAAGEDPVSYFESHFAQLESQHQVEDCLGFKVPVIVGEVLSRKILKPASLVISLGGDNHLQYVSHFIDNQLLLGVNSDFQRSEGGMEYFLPADLKCFAPRLLKGEYLIEGWSRLHATIIRSDGRSFSIPIQAVSEIYVGAWARVSISKYYFIGERHKDSGAIIALPAGAGEGSWFNSAGGNREDDHTKIPRTEQVAWFLATEIWSGRTLATHTGHQTLRQGGKIEINYSSYYPGTVSIDPKEGSGRNYRISRGDRAVIELGSKPLLYVIRSQYEKDS